MDSIQEIKIRLKDVASQGIDLALPAVKAALSPNTDAYNDLLLLEGRYQEVMKQLLEGVISNENSAIEINKIRKDLLNFIDSLQEAQFKQADGKGSDGTPDIYNGEVLYRIPGQMKLQEETKCIVRLAFDRKIITEDLEILEGDVLKDLRISDVMGVELLDPEGSAFKIRTLHDKVQFVEKDLFTEWLFYVKPLTGGTHPLVLKISIIEIKNGIERKRNVVLEEEVEIITADLAESGVSKDFSAAGIVLTVAQNQSGVPGAPPPSAEPRPYAPSPSPGAPVSSKNLNAPRTSSFRKMASAMSALLVLVVASWVLWTNLGPDGNQTSDIGEKRSWSKIAQNPSKVEIEDFLAEFPDGELAQVAMLKLDSIETSVWQAAIASNDAIRFKEYTAMFPDGKFVVDAQKQLQLLEKGSLVDINAGAGGNVNDIQPANPSTNAGPRPSRNQNGDRSPRPAQPETIQNTSPSNRPASDPDKAIPLASASRHPIYRGCGDNDEKKERKCTDKRIGRYIKKNLKYPEEALRKKIEGTVIVEFIVEKNGRVSGVQYRNDIGGGCAKEAVRLVQRLPKFKPGQNALGQPIRVKYRLPVKFELR